MPLTQDEMLALKPGDQVRFIGLSDELLDPSEWVGVGTILTRKETWMDDDSSVAFSYTKDGNEDYHYFAPEELEAI